MGFNTHKNKKSLEADTSAADSSCVHQWSIEPPNGPISAGVCSLCGENREFRNSYDFSAWDNRKKHSPKAASQPEVKPATRKRKP
jgi:hypothetical protein